MTNYSNSKIYKIECITGEGEIYIGSTTKKYLSQRMQTHKNDYKQWKKGKKPKTSSFDIFDLYGIDNVKITLLENVECQSRDELHAREGYYIKTFDCVNKIIPGRNKEEGKNEYMKKIGIIKCDCGGKYLNEVNKIDRHYKTIKHTDWYMNQVD